MRGVGGVAGQRGVWGGREVALLLGGKGRGGEGRWGKGVIVLYLILYTTVVGAWMVDYPFVPSVWERGFYSCRRGRWDGYVSLTLLIYIRIEERLPCCRRPPGRQTSGRITELLKG